MSTWSLLRIFGWLYQHVYEIVGFLALGSIDNKVLED
jgi:hypothetical protein